MAPRQFKLEIVRNGGVAAELYVHEDDTLELVDPDSGKQVEYLITKLNILRDLYRWMREHNVHSFEMNKVEE